jgi:hypothetical protein
MREKEVIKKMAETKYGKYVIPADLRIIREGEQPTVVFSATPHGVNAGWAIMVSTKIVDEEMRKRLFENPHTHDYHQFITYFGSDPYDIGKFDAEISVCLGEEREEHIINRPTVLHFPPGLIHSYGRTPHRIEKPVYHLDINFAPEYKRKDLPE